MKLLLLIFKILITHKIIISITTESIKFFKKDESKNSVDNSIRNFLQI